MKKFALYSILVMIFPIIFSINAEQANNSIVFVILTHLRNHDDNRLWQRCYRSIREFYPQEKIVILDDNSKVEISNLPTDVIYVKSEFPGAGELLPYYYFLRFQWAEKMIVVHDSMLVLRPFYSEELNHSLKYHWYFDIHYHDDDKAINYLLSRLNNANELIQFNMHHKDAWWGCFGVACTIDLPMVKMIEEKYALTESLKRVINNRDHRMALERVFGIITFKEQWVNKHNCSNFGVLAGIPFVGQIDIDDSQIEHAKRIYGAALLKTWHSR